MKRDPAKVAECRERRARGESLRQIAERVGVSEGTVRNWTKGVDASASPAAEQPRTLVEDLVALAVELDAAEAPREATVCRRAVEALQAAQSAEAVDDGIAPPSPDAPAIESIRYVVAKNRAAYQRCVDAGFERQAQLYSRTIATLMPALVRAEKEVQSDADAVVVQRSEIDAARARFDDRMRALAAQPLTCEACGAELRMALALREAGVDG